MVDPTLTISIDRSGLGKDPLVFSGSEDGTAWGVLDYTDPPRQARIVYAGDSPWLHGSTAVASTWQQTFLTWDAAPTASSELELRVMQLEVIEAIRQFSYQTTVTINGQGDKWQCDMGSLTPAARDYVDLTDFSPAFTISLPCKPFPVTP